MKQLIRILVASVVFLSGAALIPLIGLPSEGFRWQTFADAYQPPMININYESGNPGSFFTLTGYNFPPSGEVSILVNDTVLGTVTTDSLGSFTFLLHSVGAEEGYYFVSTDEPDSPIVRIWLHGDLPFHAQEGEGTLFDLPPDLAIMLQSLPFLSK